MPVRGTPILPPSTPSLRQTRQRAVKNSDKRVSTTSSSRDQLPTSQEAKEIIMQAVDGDVDLPPLPASFAQVSAEEMLDTAESVARSLEEPREGSPDELLYDPKEDMPGPSQRSLSSPDLQMNEISRQDVNEAIEGIAQNRRHATPEEEIDDVPSIHVSLSGVVEAQSETISQLVSRIDKLTEALLETKREVLETKKVATDAATRSQNLSHELDRLVHLPKSISNLTPDRLSLPAKQTIPDKMDLDSDESTATAQNTPQEEASGAFNPKRKKKLQRVE
jgi:hypothetical protein